MGLRPVARAQGWLPMATSLDWCLGHMKYNMADASQALLMLLEAENTQCPGPGAWLTLLGQESGEQMWCLLPHYSGLSWVLATFARGLVGTGCGGRGGLQSAVVTHLSHSCVF